jgi:hypothetical protein
MHQQSIIETLKTRRIKLQVTQETLSLLTKNSRRFRASITFRYQKFNVGK